MISVKNLSFVYPTKKALNQVSFQVDAGTITALVGPNGAGKSTLLRNLAALENPIGGIITIDDLDVLENPRAAHVLMGYLPDFYGLYDDLTVKQCLLYHALAQNIPQSKINDRIKQTAELLKIENLLLEEVGTLSRGQRQRLAIAQAIIHRPKVLLLDEPASGLDPEARFELSQALISLKEEGITLIVSSHILAELEEYCTHMIVLRDGKIVKQCSIKESANRMIDIYMETRTDKDH